MHFPIVGKPKVILTSKNLENLPVEIKNMLDDYVDIVVDELPSKFPPVRTISHHIDLIHDAILRNKATYRMTPMENEEVGGQVQELLDKILIKET